MACGNYRTAEDYRDHLPCSTCEPRQGDISKDKVLAAVDKLWKATNNQRLGQLLLNLTRNSAGETNTQILWNASDEDLLKLIADYLDYGW